MQAKCLAQHLARGQRWGTEAAVLLAAVVWSWQQTDRALREEAPPTGTGPGTSSQRAPLLSASASAETSNDQAPGPPAFPALPAQGGKRTRKQDDIYQESVGLKRGLSGCAPGPPHGDPKLSHFPRSKLLSQRDLERVQQLVLSGREMRLREGR